MSWLHLPSVTATQGSITVAVNNAFETEHVQIGDALLIGQFAPVEIVGIHSRQLTLRDAWPNATQTAQAGAIIPTAADFQLAASLLRDATTVTQGNFAAMEKWWTENTDVTFAAYDGSKYSVPSAKKMDETFKKNVLPNHFLMESMAQANRDKYAASGFVHFGKMAAQTSTRLPINEGLHADTTLSNWLLMGYPSGGVGTSKTDYPVINTAGFETQVSGLGGTGANVIKLPVAPRGYDVCDSSGNARGTGKSTLNLRTENDPKYGDTAGTDNEAVARAFEGNIKNGDARNGTDNWVGQNGTVTAANGELTFTAAKDYGRMVQGIPAGTLLPNTTYTFTAIVSIDAGYVNPYIYSVEGNYMVDTRVDAAQGETTYTATFTTGSTVTSANLYFEVRSAAAVTKVKSVCLKRATEEVTINRKDIYGGEFFLEKVDPVTGRLYKGGMIQGRVANWLGKATTESTRAITYYAVYEGDTTSRGLSHALADLTFAQVTEAMADPENNLWYMPNGDLVQWRMRQRSIAGMGNGNWHNVDSNNPSIKYPDYILNFSGGGTQAAIDTRVSAQGALDAPATDRAVSWFATTYASSANNAKPELGVFTIASGAASQAYNGECYFHYWGSVSRLNHGKTHPFNSLGSALCSDGKKWHETTDVINSIRDCFIDPVGGDIASGKSGRDGGNLYHDGIGPSGQGGIIDDRLSAWDMSSAEEAAKFDAKVKSGVARGEQYLPFTEIATQEGATNNSVTDFFVSKTAVRAAPEIGSKISQVSGAAVITRRVVSVSDTGNLWQVFVDEAYSRTAGTYVISQSSLNISVEGNKDNGFSCIDVSASPDVILSEGTFANGWMGYWGGLLNEAQRTVRRKVINASALIQTKMWNTTSWSSQPRNFNAITNVITGASNTSYIEVVEYQASPYVAHPSENEVVFNGDAGIGSVFTSCYYNAIRGVLFAESLIGKVLTNHTSMDGLTTNHKLKKVSLYDGRIDAASQRPTTHEPISLGAPSNGSVAVKALMRQVALNNGLHLGYNFKEMKYSALSATDMTGNSTAQKSVGVTYRVTSGRFQGLYMTCVQATTADFDNAIWQLLPDGRVISSVTGVVNFRLWQNGWGDDDIIQAIHNTSTINDYNGVSCLYGSAITKRYGWGSIK